jgi:hypothetical protein
MSRFGPAQPDLFGPAQEDLLAVEAAADPPENSIGELQGLLAKLRVADRLPWPDVAAAMAEEQRVLGLARRAGAEGEALLEEIFAETERLFAAAERVKSLSSRD